MGLSVALDDHVVADHGVRATSARLVTGVLRVIVKMENYGETVGYYSFCITAND